MFTGTSYTWYSESPCQVLSFAVEREGEKDRERCCNIDEETEKEAEKEEEEERVKEVEKEESEGELSGAANE